MRQTRLLLSVSLLAIAFVAQAQSRKVIGRVGEAMVESGVYSTPSRQSRLLRKLKPDDRVVIKHSDRQDWDMVLLKTGNFGYAPAADIVDLPYVAYLTPRVRNRSLSSRSGTAVSSEATGNPMVDYALKFEGTPYEWGGNDLVNGIDCSGFVKKVVAGTIGYNLPRTAAEQALVGQPIYRLEELRAGDRLYFKGSHESRISHTGIYMGNGKFVHSSHGKHGVSTDSLLQPSWRKMLVAARR